MGRKKEENRRFYPTEEDPRYGQVFQIVEIQFQDIDRRFTGWIGRTGNIKFTKRELIAVGKDWIEWKKNKRKISDKFIELFDKLGITKAPLKEVVALKVHYLGDQKGRYQIL